MRAPHRAQWTSERIHVGEADLAIRYAWSAPCGAFHETFRDQFIRCAVRSCWLKDRRSTAPTILADIL